ncbi:hypothetical protein JCM10207_005071 [Rhodosporidiobolus poonsookiae]
MKWSEFLSSLTLQTPLVVPPPANLVQPPAPAGSDHGEGLSFPSERAPPRKVYAAPANTLPSLNDNFSAALDRKLEELGKLDEEVPTQLIHRVREDLRRWSAPRLRNYSEDTVRALFNGTVSAAATAIVKALDVVLQVDRDPDDVGYYINTNLPGGADRGEGLLRLGETGEDARGIKLGVEYKTCTASDVGGLWKRYEQGFAAGELKLGPAVDDAVRSLVFKATLSALRLNHRLFLFNDGYSYSLLIRDAQKRDILNTPFVHVANDTQLVLFLVSRFYTFQDEDSLLRPLIAKLEVPSSTPSSQTTNLAPKAFAFEKPATRSTSKSAPLPRITPLQGQKYTLVFPPGSLYTHLDASPILFFTSPLTANSGDGSMSSSSSERHKKPRNSNESVCSVTDSTASSSFHSLSTDSASSCTTNSSAHVKQPSTSLLTLPSASVPPDTTSPPPLPSTSSAQPAPASQVVDLTQLLGDGLTSTVFLADLEGRKVAIKLSHINEVATLEAEALFLTRHASVLRGIAVDMVCLMRVEMVEGRRVELPTDAGGTSRWKGARVMVMEYGGEAPKEWHDLNLEQRLSLFVSLICVHRAGLEHGDAEPRNAVAFPSTKDDPLGSPRWLDWGHAREQHVCEGRQCPELARVARDMDLDAADGGEGEERVQAAARTAGVEW